MVYGSGAPLWGKKGESLMAQQDQHHSGTLNNRGGTAYQPQQSGVGGNYQPPKQQTGLVYAEQQTHIMEDTMRKQYETEGIAQTVLSQMTTQRHQLQGAHGNVWEMREATEKAKRELMDLQVKWRAKKRRLQMIIAILGLIDLLLFVRLVQCGGSFFCRHRW
jgi:hypothetical protein